MITTTAVLIGAGGYALVTRPSLSPGFTPLVDGRVTASLFQDGRNPAPRVAVPSGPPRGTPPAGLRVVGTQPPEDGPVLRYPRTWPTSWPTSPVNASTVTSAAPEVKTVPVVELNSATLDQLQTLPGVTRECAARIVAGRPYHVFGDVVTRAGIPAAIVDHLSPMAFIRSVEREPSSPEPPLAPAR